MTQGKREAPRVPVPARVQGEVMAFQPMTILDLSERGMRIETAFALVLDSLHQFRLTLGDRPVIVQGRIAHSEIADIGDGGVRYRTGIEFVEPSEHALSVIREFVDVQRLALEAPRPAVIDAEVAGDG